MRVLLAGSTGVIGSELRRQLQHAGHEVTGLARTQTPRSEIGVDLLDRDAVMRAIDGRSFDAVVHQATALRRRPLFASHMLMTNRLRTEGTSTLLAVARATGATKVVTASAFTGYGLSDHGAAPLDETEPFGVATDAAQRALLSNEQQVRAFGGVALRYGLVYGTGPAAFVAARDDRLLPIVHVADAASAVVSALARYRSGQAFNIADERPTSWTELHRAAAVAAGVSAPRAVASWLLRASAPYISDLVADTSMTLSTAKARRELRWKPLYPSFAEGLAEQVRVGAAT